MVSGIQPQGGESLGLFEDASPQNQVLLRTLDVLNHQAGKELVTIGSRLQTATWQAASTMRSPAYTTRWTDIATVSA